MTEQNNGPVLEAPANQIVPIKAALVVIVTLSTVIGLLPYVIYVGRHLPAILFAGLLAAVAGSCWRLRGFVPLSTEKPRLGEFVLGGLSTLFATTMASFFGLLFFWFTKGVLWLVHAVAGWFGKGPDLPAETIAFWVSLIIVAVLGFTYIFFALDGLCAKLYPKTAGVRSPFYSLLLERRRLILMILIAVLVLAAILFLFRSGGRSFAIAIMLYLFYTGAILDNLGKSTSTTPAKMRALKALVKLLKTAGYEATLSPRTGKPEVDPLIVTVDILAQSSDRALVIEVKTRARNNQPVEWHEASRLRNAAWALEDTLKQHDWDGDVSPMMVLLGRKQADSLKHFLQEEPMKVFEVEDPGVINEIIAEQTAERLHQIAADQFGIEVVDPVREKTLTPTKEAT